MARLRNAGSGSNGQDWTGIVQLQRSAAIACEPGGGSKEEPYADTGERNCEEREENKDEGERWSSGGRKTVYTVVKAAI